MKTDPILLEILNNRFGAVVNEMAYTIYRTAFSLFVKETWDFVSGLVSPKGEVFAFPEIGATILLGSPLEDAVRYVKEYRPGDVIITNDPYISGAVMTQVSDINLYKPFFYEGELICFIWDFLHAADIGGFVPGSIAPSAHDVFQEGLRIPPTKLYREGTLNQEFVDLFLANTRTPQLNWGDLKALIAAVHGAEPRLVQTVQKYGVETVKQAITDVLDYGELRSRRIVGQIPDGTYRFSDYVEGYRRFSELPIRIKLAMKVEGSDIFLDFTGTDPQVPFAINIPTAGKSHPYITYGLLNFLRTMDPSMPLCSGILRPFRVNLPKGSLINPEPPASCGARWGTTVRVMDVVFGALAQAVDGVIPAGGGDTNVIFLSLIDPRSGQYKVNLLQPLPGGSGARPDKDGLDGTDPSAGWLRNVPNEELEIDMPIMVKRYKLVENQVPAGRFRGGLGVEFEFEVLTPECILTARGRNREDFVPWGREGGQPGIVARAVLNPDTERARDLGVIDVVNLQANDVVRIVSSCGAGYGSPLERDPELVAKDVEDGFLSVEAAEKEYGVALAGDGIDFQRTAQLRSQRQHLAPSSSPFSFGPARGEYEQRWSEAAQDAVNELLTQLPATVRDKAKRKLFQELAKDGGSASPTKEDVIRAWREIAAV